MKRQDLSDLDIETFSYGEGEYDFVTLGAFTLLNVLVNRRVIPFIGLHNYTNERSVADIFRYIDELSQKKLLKFDVKRSTLIIPTKKGINSHKYIRSNYFFRLKFHGIKLW